MVHIGLLMMLKNEQKRLQVTLDSLIDDQKQCKVDSIMVYDTGSTDNTLDILSEFCKTHRVKNHIKHGKFEDFSSSRNVALRFADQFAEVDFILMLDCNDEYRGDVRPFCETVPKEQVAWLVEQCWWSGVVTRYYNIRLIRPRVGWKYRGVVHEYITRDNPEELIRDKVTSSVQLFQDRTQDDDKTGKRFSRDKKLLLREYRRDKDPRTVFYLAQTYLCLNEKDLALKYYIERSKMLGFYEERYHSFHAAGKLLMEKGMTERAIFYFLSAIEITPRVEPLLELVKYYRDRNFWLATQFAKSACSLPDPDAILFWDEGQYRYERFHLLGIVAYYAGDFEAGRKAIVEAIRVANQDIDKHNLSHYPPVNSEPPKPIELPVEIESPTV
jgi:glycosyltransferase involved in cell wall biosynthesis